MSGIARYNINVPEIPYDVWSIKYNVSIDALAAYKESLITHLTLVNQYGNKFGVNQRNLELHDRTKWTKKEFPFYANRFHGDMVHSQAFISAWNHHLANNMHHPEYWVSQSGVYAPMPRIFIMEMIADWHAASYQYTGSDDIQDWLNTKLDKTKFHSASLGQLAKELKDIGYDL